MVFQTFIDARTPAVLGEARLQPAHRLAKPAATMAMVWWSGSTGTGTGWLMLAACVG